MIQSVAHEQPVVLVVDDVHWIDAQSYRILEGLFARIATAQVLCLTASRPERTPLTAATTSVPLPPLTTTQVASFVAALGLVPDGVEWSDDFIPRLHQATRGSPLAILETLHLAIDDNILSIDDGRWHSNDSGRLNELLRAGEALRLRVRALTDEQRLVLATLAVAGTPLRLDEPALLELEKLGLVMRKENSWTAAHDEIANAAEETLDDKQRADVNRRLGVMFVGDSDPQMILRGLRHLADANDDELFRRHSRRYARLTRGTPMVVRLAAAAIVVVLIGAAMIGFRYKRDALLPRLVYADSVGTSEVTVHPQDWDGRTTPVSTHESKSQLRDAARAHLDLPPAISPDGRSVAWTQDSGDSTTLDIWIRTPAGTRRLTNQARDDVVRGWLPDGSALIGTTNRWSPREHGNYDIAVFDTATGAARSITRNLEHEGNPVVSPDGTRIAFIRESTDGPIRLCVIAFDALREAECREPNGYPMAQLLGWISPTELVISFDSSDARPVGRLDWDRNKYVGIIGPYFYRAELSADRHWMVGALSAEGMRGLRDWIVPIGNPAQARPVDNTGGNSARLRWWEGGGDASEVIDRIELTDTTRTILPGLSTRFRVRAFTNHNIEARIYAPVHWQTRDSTVAVVDSLGDVFARGQGSVVLSTSLAGWRSVKRTLRIVGRPAQTVLSENWSDDWYSRWIVFGEPTPIVVDGPHNVRAFWNHGDGTYQSMAVTRKEFSASEGLGLELRVSTKLVTANWQRLRTALVAGVDTALFRNANQNNAPPTLGRIDAMCGATYPGGDGKYGSQALTGTAVMTPMLNIPAPAGQIQSGEWWTLRLQILPDGRCGIAVNGKALWISPESIPIDVPYRVRLGDESSNSRLLHGPITVWTGVRTDIDWSKVASYK